MPTTFNVISLGVLADIDTTEGNTVAENAASLVGLTLGDIANPLWEQTQSFSPGTGGSGGGNTTAYDMDNNASSENFRINGGANQTFDGTSIYNATITYTDGTTATITAVIFQDTAGNSYLAPEFSANADQLALEAGPIRSLTLDSLVGNSYSGLTASRQTSNFAVCFTQGTMIETPQGERAVETLVAGDLVQTFDNGPQPIRWIGGRTVPAIMGMEPVLFDKGSLGTNIPKRPMMLSRQHRLMLDTVVAERMTGTRQVLVPAHKLSEMPGVNIVTTLGFVTYWHFLCDQHEIVIADGTPAETLFLGQQACKSMSSAALEEVKNLFPDLVGHDAAIKPARTIMKGARQKRLINRLRENAKSPVSMA